MTTAESAHDVAIRRCRRVIAWMDRHRLIEQLPVVIALVVVAVGIWRSEYQADVSSDRDQARLYQRCEQSRPLAIAVNAGIALSPALLERVRRDAPGSLDVRGRLTVPDCTATYPRGARESYRFPDAVQTTRGTP